MATNEELIMDSIFCAEPVPQPKERRPDYECDVSDCFRGLKGHWIARYDCEEIDCQPDQDWRTQPSAVLRYVQFEPELFLDHRITRYEPRMIEAMVLSEIQDLIDEDLMGVLEWENQHG